MYSIKERIKELCDERNISLPKLEQAVGFGNSTIVKWDKVSPTLAKLTVVAEYFGVPVTYFLEDEKENPTLSSGDISDARKKLDSELKDMSDEELLFLMSKIKAIKEMRE